MYVNIRDLFGRDDTDCGSGTTFYSCGDFRGCCSKDPCNNVRNAVCPDDSGDDGNGGNNGGNDGATSSSGGTSASPESSFKTASQPATTSLGTPSTSLLFVTKTAANGEITTVVTPGPANETGSSNPGSESDNAGGSVTDPESGGGKLSKGAIGGIAVGVCLAILFFLVAMFLFRRKRKNRNSNVTVLESSSGPASNLGGDTAVAKLPDASSTPGSMAMAQGQGNDPFAPFGGKYDPRASHNGASRTSYVSSMGETIPISPATAVSRNTMSVDGTQIQGPVQLDSQPVNPTLEMDASSAAIAKKPVLGNVSEMDATTPSRTIPELDSMVSVPQSLRPGGDPKRLSPNVPPTVAEDSALGDAGDTRATLNPTEEEKKGKRAYVTSWSQYEGAPATSR